MQHGLVCAVALQYPDAKPAGEFVEQTGVDALGVSIGRAHLHGRTYVHLDFSLLSEIAKAVTVPLVLHGASSVHRADLSRAIQVGIRKINVGSVLKRSYFEAVRHACALAGDAYNPYEVVGSGQREDVLAAGRVALEETVEDLMHLFGSAGRG